MSDDGALGFTIIGFVGSVFSPYYARARRASPAADPMDHCAVHVGLYGPGIEAWAMTEWPRAQVSRSPEAMQIGSNRWHWHDGELVIAFDEGRAPFGRPVRGTVRISADRSFDRELELNPSGRHRWRPVVPVGRFVLDLETPERRVEGSAYHDVNYGDAGLEDGFGSWWWMRAAVSGGTAVAYDVEPRSGERRRFAHVFGHDGAVSELGPSDPVELSKGGWGVDRAVPSEGEAPRLIRTLSDTPFYVRSVVETTLAGERITAVHESLDLRRFERRWVQFLLPFKIRGRHRATHPARYLTGRAP